MPLSMDAMAKLFQLQATSAIEDLCPRESMGSAVSAADMSVIAAHMSPSRFRMHYSNAVSVAVGVPLTATQHCSVTAGMLEML